MARRATKPTTRTSKIEHGSAGHRALLGLDDPHLSEERKAELEIQLKTKPEPSANLDYKLPVNRENYDPDTRYGPGDEIIDGWTRRGR